VDDSKRWRDAIRELQAERYGDLQPPPGHEQICAPAPAEEAVEKVQAEREPKQLELFSRGAARSNQDVVDNGGGLPRTAETVDEADAGGWISPGLMWSSWRSRRTGEFRGSRDAGGDTGT
jgi:hypothetical protein